MYTIYTLTNGLRVITEHMPYVQSVSVGVWVGAGVMTETSDNSGISHFIEHMVFKGTTTRSCKQIAEEIDDIGGALNAFTAKDCTCYYIKTLSEHLNTSCELLADLIRNPLFDGNDIATERGVILEELSMNEDSPEELVHDTLYASMWPQHALGMPILGSADNIARFDADALRQYRDAYYTAANTVVCVVGNFDGDALRDTLQSLFGDMAIGSAAVMPASPLFNMAETAVPKDIEQLHCVLGYSGLSRRDERRHALIVVSNILGGSVSSRLFQSVREEHGLAYTIYASLSHYVNAGVATIYFATNPAARDDCLGLVQSEVARLIRDGVSDTELRRTKEQVKTGLVLSMESTSARSAAYGQSLLLSGEVSTDEQKLAAIGAVTAADCIAIAEEIYRNPCIAEIRQIGA